MSPRRRQRADEEPKPGLVDFLSEVEEGTPTAASQWPAAGAEIVGHSGGGDATTRRSIANYEEFPTEQVVPHRSAVTVLRLPLYVGAPPAPPKAMPRVITFSVYALVAIAGAAVGWFAVGFSSQLAPEANNATLVASASPEWVPFAALRQPVRGSAIGEASADLEDGTAAPEDSVEARVGELATPPPNAANVASVNQAARPAMPIPVTPPPEPPRSTAGALSGDVASRGNVLPARGGVPPVSAPAAIDNTAPTVAPTPSLTASRPDAPVAASTPEVPKPDPPRSEPSRPAAAPTEAPRAEAPRAEAPRADASRPELPRAEAARRRDTGLIETVLDRYVGAFNTLDAQAARAVWPNVDARALDCVFTQLEQQELTFEECRVELDEVRAEAVCRGVARYVPKVGSRSSRSTPRQWTFKLQKVEERWTIDGVNIR